jgi:hypothetical protein
VTNGSPVHDRPTQPIPPVPPRRKILPVWAWVAIGVAVVLFCCGGVAAVMSMPEEEQGAIVTDSPGATTRSGGDPQREQSPEPEREWRTIYELSGSGDYSGGETFELQGSRLRFLYNVESEHEGMEVFFVYLLPEGHDFDTRGGIPIIDGQAGEHRSRVDGDSDMGPLRQGSYYLEVGAANCSWTIKVQEMR